MKMELKKILKFCICVVQFYNLCMSDSTCSVKETVIKFVDIFPTFNLYQNARMGYMINRTQYAMTLNFDYPNYSNRTVWRYMLDSGNLKDVAVSALELQLTTEEKKKYPELLMVPTMIGALTIVYNLPNITELNLTLDTIVDIYLGIITHWNHSSLQIINPGVQLPAKNIIVTGNKFDFTPDTYFLTSTLSAYSEKFNQIYGVIFDTWPNTMNFSANQQFMTSSQVVNKTAYSLGYASIVNSMFYGTVGTPIAKIRTDVVGAVNDRFIDTVLSSASTVFKENNNQLAKQLISESTLMKTAYPFIYFHYMVINRTTSPGVSCCVMQETTGFLEYFIDSTAKNLAETVKNGYFPLPKVVSDYVKASVIPLITCNDTIAINEFRKYTLQTSTVLMESSKNALAIGLSLLSVVIVLVILFALYNRRVQLSKEKFWFIELKEFHLQEDKLKSKLFGSAYSINTVKSEKSAVGSMLKMGIDPTFTKHSLIRGHWKRNDMSVLLKRLNLKHISNWNTKTKSLVASFVKDITHTNLCAVHGITTLDRQPHLISQHCTKGTLNHVLATCPYQLSRDIKCSLAQDVVSGLKYLHQKNIVHGNLSSITCYVDGVWNVKLTDWAISSITSSENVKPLGIKMENLEDEECLINLLYLDPETLPQNEPTVVNDMYSYGMLLVEIFTRKLPFSEEVELCANTYPDIIKNKFNKIQTIPEMNPNEVPQEIQILVKKLTGPLVCRPNVRSAAKQMHKFRGRANKSIVDIMMETMEKYVEDLEEKVFERTSELTDITNQMKDLLHELLPPQIATKFIKREPIEPEFFECVTIFFSDIVGFTTISAKSTPYQVMFFLNELWNLFDRVMENFDVYKVDTIGDSYMAASGLPKRNGINHCKHICDLALRLRQVSQNFFVPHLPDEKVQIRMGINSGPVTAGIVGRKMPQYCIFGDTVNTASRMESTSLPLKIHVSEYSSKLVLQYFPDYIFSPRGETEVKGKGVMKTFWLMDIK